jgi:hypothetical protein
MFNKYQRKCRDLKEERLLQLSWVLSCLPPGVVKRFNEDKFVSLFGTPCSDSFAAATDLAVRKDCTFTYDRNNRTAIFQRCPIRRVGDSGGEHS